MAASCPERSLASFAGSNAGTPISKLPEDILWRIFLMNANMNNDPPDAEYLDEDLGEDENDDADTDADANNEDNAEDNDVEEHTEGQQPTSQEENTENAVADAEALKNSSKPEFHPTVNSRPFHALTIAHRSSQVCQRWRDVLLRSTSIWGRLIHIDSLVAANVNWRSEVIDRTGRAALFIKGNVHGRCPASREFFHYFLMAEWPRIRRMDVTIAWSRFYPLAPLWRALHYTAEHLESIELKFHPADRWQAVLVDPRKIESSDTTDKQPPTYDPVRVFSNHAPALREFTCTHIGIDLKAPWLSHIRRLTLAVLSRIWYNSTIIEAIMDMPLLDTFAITCCLIEPSEDYKIDPSMRKTHPRLQTLAIGDMVPVCDAFLEHMNPSPGMSLNIMSPDLQSMMQDMDTFQKDYPSITRFMAAYSQRQKQSPNLFSCNMTADLLGICELAPRTTDDRPQHHLTTLNVGVQTRINYTLPFSQLSCYDVSKFKTLTFESTKWKYDAGDPTSRAHFLAMSGVETLQTTPETLKVFVELFRPEMPVPFPKLHTVKLQGSTVSQRRAEHSLLEFLAWRRVGGCPVKFLDFTQCPHLYTNRFEAMVERFAPEFQVIV